MHFLGLSGMPRRIPDYIDIFNFFNNIATIGSLLSFGSACVFVLFVIFSIIFKKRLPVMDPWSVQVCEVVPMKRYATLRARQIVPGLIRCHLITLKKTSQRPKVSRAVHLILLRIKDERTVLKFIMRVLKKRKRRGSMLHLVAWEHNRNARKTRSEPFYGRMSLIPIFADIPYDNQLSFQDPATPVMEGIIYFHNELMGLLIFIFIFVSWMLLAVILGYGQYFKAGNTRLDLGKFFQYMFFTTGRFRDHFLGDKLLNLYFIWAEENIRRTFYNKYRLAKINASFTAKENQHVLLEIVWTIIPCLFILSIMLPSFALLYGIDELVIPIVTIKILGYQWYWNYQHVNYIEPFGENFRTDYVSTMVPDEDLDFGQLRLLTVDVPLFMPVDVHVRLLVGSMDVIHSFAVPSFGVKNDAIPGRLNQVFVFIKRAGIFYGQCSELCGVRHAFMPIEVYGLNFEDYDNYFINKLFYFVGADDEYFSYEATAITNHNDENVIFFDQELIEAKKKKQ